jgi:predicted ATPase
MKRNWYAITGGNSSGKSTLLEELKRRGYNVVPEAARVVIEENAALGTTITQTRLDEQLFQNKVLERKVTDESSIDCELLTFFDRGMQDTIAYYEYYGWNIPSNITSIMKRAHYKLVFILNPLKTYEHDQERVEGERFAYEMQDLLRNAYERFGNKVIDIPVMAVEKRADFIVEHLKSDGTIST